MSQTPCDRSDLLVATRWFNAGSDLSRPPDINQSADRPLIRPETLSKCPPRPRGLPSVHTSSRRRTSLPPAIDPGVDSKSP
jgi:hypothetical protein